MQYERLDKYMMKRHPHSFDVI